MIGNEAFLALGVEKKFIHRAKTGTFGKFEKILKHFRNLKPLLPLRDGNAWNRWIKNFRRNPRGRQLRLGVRRIGLKFGS
ncbi:MAG: hypothetical protein NTU84_01490 [Verrucomicrobia bacterium]|jgi:hypothetical protein|nr:hypothetical protein [Verrucomicrobiota bacterium]